MSQLSRTFLRLACGDRARPWLALLAAGWLLVMGQRYASFSTQNAVGYEACVAAPGSCGERDLLMSLWTVIEVEDEGYVIRKVGEPVPVAGDPAGLSPGDRVSVVGHYDEARSVVVEVERLVHRLRRVKEILSVAGLLAVLIMLPAVYTLRGWRVVRRG